MEGNHLSNKCIGPVIVLDSHPLVITKPSTEDCLLFVRRRNKFAAWAVLGEGCSSARDPNRIRAL